MLKKAQITVACMLGVGSIFLAFWMAGAFYHVAYKANPIDAGVLTWFTYMQAYHSDPAERMLLLKCIALAFALIGIAVIAAVRYTNLTQQSLHGEARFATVREMKKGRLFERDGIIVGKVGNKFIKAPDVQSVALIAPTDAGKGVGCVLPNLYSYNGSAAVGDLKLENFLLTSKYRAQNGHTCFLWAPFDREGRTHQYNPLGLLSDDPRVRVTEVMAIAWAWYPDGGDDSMWQETARNLFVGIALYLCETPELPCTFGEVLRQGSGKGKPLTEHIQSLIHERNFKKVVTAVDDKGEKTYEWQPIEQWDGKGLSLLSSACVNSLNTFLGATGNTSSSIYTTFSAPLALWHSPMIDAATSGNSFNLAEIREKKLTIYIGLTPDVLPQAGKLMNLFLSQLINLNTRELFGARPEIKHQCLLLNDEAAAVGYMSILEKGIPYIRGYGLRALTVYQSVSQARANPPRGYGIEGSKTFLQNHALKSYYTPKDDDADQLSDHLGYQTVKSRSTKIHSRLSGTESDHKRALMLPQELREMDRDTQIITVENMKPIRCKKIKYYQERVFIDRMKSVSPSLDALGKKMPTKEQIDAAMNSGELSIDVPLVDFELHQAIIDSNLRPVTAADVEEGVDLDLISKATTTIPAPQGPDATDEEVDLYIDNVWATLETNDGVKIEPEPDSVALEVDADTGEILDMAPSESNVINLVDMSRLESTEE